MRKITLGFSIVALAAAALAACSPLTVLNALTPSASYERFTVQYGWSPRHTLDVYVPSTRSGPAPVVVFFHGGSWNSGDREGYVFLGEALASRGIVAVIANYRLYPEVRYPEFLKDGALAVAWTAKHVFRYGGDPGRLFVMGHSSGAYNAAMLALDDRWLSAVGLRPALFRGWIGLAGPYDFLPIKNPEVKPVFFHPDTPPESQPINHADASSPPALLIAARDDDLVNPQRNTVAMAEHLRKAGVPVTLKLYGTVSHTSLIGAFARPLRPLAPVLQDVEQFVEERSSP